MALTDAQYNQIESYLSGQFTPEEEAVFLKNVAANDEWHTELEFQKLIHGKQDVYQQLPGLLASVDRGSEAFKGARALVDAASVKLPAVEKPAEKKKVVSVSFRSLLMAASLLAVIIATAVFYNPGKRGNPSVVTKPKQHKEDTGNNKLLPLDITPSATLLLAYEKNYSVYDAGDNIPPDLQNPVVNYKLKKYGDAVTDLKNRSGTRGGSGDDETKLEVYTSFYLGLCLLELNKNDEAFIALSKAFKKRELVRAEKDAIIWYYGLTCLKTGKKQAAVNAFSLISGAANSKRYGTKAAEILAELK